MPAAWRPRIRHRFGHPEAMARLMERLANPAPRCTAPSARTATAVIEIVTDTMLSAG